MIILSEARANIAGGFDLGNDGTRFILATIMASTGQLAADSLVWKSGMTQWTKAGTLNELNDIFEI